MDIDWRSVPCDEWQGCVTVKGGYGIRSINGKHIRVHRLEWEEKRGPIPSGMGVLHHCDNPPCREILHLFLGTNADNMADKIAKGRQRNGSLYGEEHPRSRLNWDMVEEIRDRHLAGETQTALGIAFGIDRSTVGMIVKYKTWKVS
jgi:hypothetical protein